MRNELVKKIIRRAVKCVCFALIFLLLLQLCSMVLVPRNDKAEDSTLNTVVFGYLGEPDHPLDVVMVGNSDLNNGISPVAMYRQYGITSFASGQPRQNPLTAWLRVKEALARQSPRVLVLEVDAMYRNPNMHKNHWKMFVDKVKAFPRQVYGYSDTFMNNAVGTGVGYLFAGVKYHSRWKELTRDDFTDIRRKFYHYVGKGYLIHTMTVPYQGGFDYMEPGGRDEPLSKEALRCLHRVMELCKERGIQLMLLEMPSASSWSYEKHQAVSEFARQNGLPFLDLNVEAQQGRMVFDWTKHSKDGGDHLNLFGAEIATAYLGAYLKEHYDLPDRRQDPDYAFWKEDAAYYERNRRKELEKLNEMPEEEPPLHAEKKAAA